MTDSTDEVDYYDGEEDETGFQFDDFMTRLNQIELKLAQIQDAINRIMK